MYKVGDRVVYPMQGAGKIVDMVTKEMLGEEHDFFILKMPIASIKISIPVDNINNIGIRPVMSEEEGIKVMEILHAETTEMPDNWSQRYRENMESLKTGDPFEMAAIIRNLQVRDMERGLSTSEKKMLNKTKKMLISELVIVGSMTAEEAQSMIDEAITLDEDLDDQEK
ncbi:CarD family transcriptional regulator [Kallipyga massiliensis]|uniref:CarD family transcriptional regulator n=1 Tax=Kallipyga massiliensis TaxID=1472764 RepID=UPI0004BA3F35|nr:CarD family transcriptional regulator [Kallipyga massiliensis]